MKTNQFVRNILLLAVIAVAPATAGQVVKDRITQNMAFTVVGN